MTPSTILFLDRTAGRALCALMSLASRIRRLLRPPAYSPPRKILFIKLIEMGSSVLACPAFAAASERVGRDNIFILLFRQNRPIIDLLPYFPPENVITIDDSRLTTFVPGMLAALLRIRRLGIDTAIDLEGLTRSSAAITWMTGARNRVGYYNFHSEGPYRGRLFTHELTYNFQHHVSEMFLALVTAAFHSPDQRPLLKEAVTCSPLPAFQPAPGEREALRRSLAECAGAPCTHPLILLNPNCSDLLPLRRWPEENMIELGRRLLAENPAATVIVTGSSSEGADAERIARTIGSLPRCLSMAGRTTFRELLTLYCEADLLISNDSGPCHFASLTPVAVVALFGPETPLLYGPLGPNKVAVSTHLACSPCVNMLNHRFSPCTDNQCMKRLGVDEVHSHARRFLATAGVTGGGEGAA